MCTTRICNARAYTRVVFARQCIAAQARKTPPASCVHMCQRRLRQGAAQTRTDPIRHFQPDRTVTYISHLHFELFAISRNLAQTQNQCLCFLSTLPMSLTSIPSFSASLPTSFFLLRFMHYEFRRVGSKESRSWPAKDPLLCIACAHVPAYQCCQPKKRAVLKRGLALMIFPSPLLSHVQTRLQSLFLKNNNKQHHHHQH
jgi:hypothetical protein